MDLHDLQPEPGAVRNRRRVGRGPGSGRGKTAGRGHKGRGSRSGGNTPPGYEGGQMPLQRWVPKRGFRPVDRVEYAVVNLERLAGFAAGSVVDPDVLRSSRIVRGRSPIKCLGRGALGHPLTVRVHAFSATARAAIVAAGGTAEVVGA
jgi:large subunit ribosomal protein L15